MQHSPRSEARLPLSGVRVLDLTHVLAGPLCTYELALMGADVIKVESPRGGDMYRRLGSDAELNAIGMGTSYLGPGANKRSLAIDLKAPEAKPVLQKLIERSDVLIHNFRPGVAERLGFGYSECKTMNNRLVYCAISGFGQNGPFANTPAVDHTVQGISGMMAVTGPRDGDPVRIGYAAADTTTAFVAAIAVLGALVGAVRTGEGCFLDVSMLEACLVAQATIYYDYLNTGAISPRVGADTLAQRGSGGTFATADGHLVVSALSQEAFVGLCRAIGREDLASDPRFAVNAGGLERAAELRAVLTEAFLADTAIEWERKLVAEGVPAGALNDIPSVAAHPQLAARGVFTEMTLASGRPFTAMNAGFAIDGVQLRPNRPPPELGSNSIEILRETGTTETHINAMIDAGIVRTH
jgi:CoA:oxalate CoA-transferase